MAGKVLAEAMGEITYPAPGGPTESGRDCIQTQGSLSPEAPPPHLSLALGPRDILQCHFHSLCSGTTYSGHLSVEPWGWTVKGTPLGRALRNEVIRSRCHSSCSQAQHLEPGFDED